MKNLYISFFAFSSIIYSLNAQSELTVNCYPVDTPFNSVSLNNDVVEYGICSQEAAFYVAVFDPATCTAWKTNYQGSNPMNEFGNFNTNGTCRPREEAYFVFQFSDSTQLAGMNDMINQIPDGFPYVIYTPVSHDYALVNGVCPTLAQTLMSKWNPAVIQDDHIMVLFGVQGQAGTFVEDTVINIDHISFTTTICDVTGLDEAVSVAPAVFYLGNDQFAITSGMPVNDVRLMSLTGESISVTLSLENMLSVTKPLAKGIYFVHGTANGKEWSQKVAVY